MIIEGREKGKCRRGHRNWAFRKDGRMFCRTCRRMVEKKWYHDNGPEQRERERIRKEGKRRREGARVTPNRIGKATVDGREQEPWWHQRVPMEPFSLWVDERVKEAFERGENFAHLQVRWGISDRLLRRARNMHEDTIDIDSVDRALLEAGELEALELMYPLEGLRETQEFALHPQVKGGKKYRPHGNKTRRTRHDRKPRKNKSR